MFDFRLFLDDCCCSQEFSGILVYLSGICWYPLWPEKEQLKGFHNKTLLKPQSSVFSYAEQMFSSSPAQSVSAPCVLTETLTSSVYVGETWSSFFSILIKCFMSHNGLNQWFATCFGCRQVVWDCRSGQPPYQSVVIWQVGDFLLPLKTCFESFFIIWLLHFKEILLKEQQI